MPCSVLEVNDPRKYISTPTLHKYATFISKGVCLVAASGALIASASLLSAQSTSANSASSKQNSSGQMCDEQKESDGRNLSLATRSKSSRVEVSATEEESSSQSHSALKDKSLAVLGVTESNAGTQGTELQCKKGSTEAKPEHPIESSPSVLQQSVSPVTLNVPIVSYKDGKLTIDPHNASLGEVIEAIRVSTGISVEYPPHRMEDRVFGRVGPAPLREALMQLLYGSGYNYLIQTSTKDPQLVKKLTLSAQNRPASPGGLQPTNQTSLEQDGRPALYGGAGFEDENPVETVQAAPPVNPPMKTAAGQSTVPGIPAGFNLQQAAAEAHKTPAQIIEEMQRHQIEILDAQAPPQ